MEKVLGEHRSGKGGAVAMSRILFADGEPHIRQLCQEELQDEGYEVAVTGQAAEVVRLVESFQPDMVILEVLLPDMSGLETGRMIKGTNRKTRIVLYSHVYPPQDLSSWGADDFVVKSPNLDRLKAVVRRLLPC
jgi:DNA-binding response OmpR family regulator